MKWLTKSNAGSKLYQGILTEIAAVIGAIAGLYVAVSGKYKSNSEMETQPILNIDQQTSASIPSPEPLNQTKPFATTQPPQSLPPINFSSTSHELYPNPGNISQTIQDGDAFRFTIIDAIQNFLFNPRVMGLLKDGISRVTISRLFFVRDAARAHCLPTECKIK